MQFDNSLLLRCLSQKYPHTSACRSVFCASEVFLVVKHMPLCRTLPTNLSWVDRNPCVDSCLCPCCEHFHIAPSGLLGIPSAPASFSHTVTRTLDCYNGLQGTLWFAPMHTGALHNRRTGLLNAFMEKVSDLLPQGSFGWCTAWALVRFLFDYV